MLIRKVFPPAEGDGLPPPAAGAPAWTLKEIVAELRGAWLLLLAFTLAGLLAGVAVLMLATPHYTARLRVAPVEAAPEPGSLQQVAALLPGAVDARRPSEMAEFLLLLRSERLAQLLDARHRLRERLFPYDAARGAFVPPDGLSDRLRDAVARALGRPGWSPPTAAKLAEVLQARLDIAETEQRGIYELRFRHPDPAFAADLLRWLHQGADELLRAAQRDRTERYIEFVTAQLQTEQNVEVRTVLRSLLLKQIQNRMLTHVDVPFAAKVLDGPSVEQQPGSPRLGRTLLVAVLTGLGLGVAAAFLRAALR